MSTFITAKSDAKLSESAHAVATSGKRLVFRKGKRIIAAVVSAADLRLLEEMDAQDVKSIRAAEARAAANDEKPIPWTVARATLGL